MSHTETERERWAKLGIKPFAHYHDDKGQCWVVVDCEDSLLCTIDDRALVLPGEESVAEMYAAKIAAFLCEDYFAEGENAETMP